MKDAKKVVITFSNLTKGTFRILKEVDSRDKKIEAIYSIRIKGYLYTLAIVHRNGTYRSIIHPFMREVKVIY